MDLKSLIRNVPDFPRPGIGFKDITTMICRGDAFSEAVGAMCEPFRTSPPDLVVGIESRGFIFGGAAALELNAGFIPIRKPGKLPAETVSETYELEYGSDTIEIHRDAIAKGARVLLMDDLLATGGTAAAALRLVRRLGGEAVGFAFLIELAFLNGRARLTGVPVTSLITFEGE